jgi:serine/threonine protein kinase
VPLEISFAIRIIDQLLSAVEYLHSYGICHRDIKLENILLARSSGIKMCDFGLAAATFDGIVRGGCGSLEYSAPEVIDGSSCNGFKADMWSVGIVIYAIFARTLPFANVTKEFDFASAVVDYSAIPHAFVPLVEHMLSFDPAARPDATDTRSFHPLNSSQTKRKEPLSALPVVVDLTDSGDLVSRLSQILRFPFDQVMSTLAQPGPSMEKLLYVLLKKKLSIMDDDPIVRGGYRSLPSPAISGRTIQESFNGCAAVVFRQLHGILMKQRCCVSSPIVAQPIIVQAREETDVRIAFNCIDDTEAGKAVLTLFVDDDFGDLAQMIVAQMRASFAPAV